MKSGKEYRRNLIEKIETRLEIDEKNTVPNISKSVLSESFLKNVSPVTHFFFYIFKYLLLFSFI